MSKYAADPFKSAHRKPRRARAPVSLPTPPVPDDGEEEAPDAGGDEYLLGRPRRSYKPHEIAYIEDQMSGYAPLVAGSPGSRVFVEEAIKSGLALQHHDERVDKALTRHGGKMDEKDRLAFDKERREIMRRHTSALDSLGALPKDTMQHLEADETLAKVHLRYRAEIENLKAAGQRVGEISQAAKDLAESVGLDQTRYGSTDVLPDSARDEALKDIQAEAPTDGE